jgi:hypothetical protein
MDAEKKSRSRPPGPALRFNKSERKVKAMIKMVSGTHEDITPMLSVGAWLKGMTLTLVDPPYRPDPVYLLDKSGNILREWEYVPWIGEVDDACEQG